MSDNKFIKISQVSSPAESRADAAQRADENRRLREQDRQTARQRIQEQQSGDSSSRLMNNLINKASLQGLNADALAEELESRSMIIRQLLSQLDEDLVEKYFDEFLFVNKIPWLKTADLLKICLDASMKGGKLADIIDVALYHYAEKRNMPLTKQILESASALQPKVRHLNVMKFVKDALVGEINPSMNLITLGPKNVEDYVILNQLLSLALAKPEEDVEQLRIEFQKNLDAFSRTREVDDRLKAIFQMLLSDEFNRTMTRNVEFVTEMFKISASSPELLALRRLMISLKLGESLRDQIFSDLEQKKTAPTSSDKRTSSSNKNLRLAQQQTEQPIAPENAEKLRPMIENRKQIYMAAQNRIKEELAKEQQLGAPQQDYNQVISDIDKYVKGLDSILAAIASKNLTRSFFNQNYWDAALTYFGKYKNEIPKSMLDEQQAESQKKFRGASQDSKFVKIAQLGTLTLFNPSSLLDGAITAAGAITTLSGVAHLDIQKMLGGLVFTLLYKNNKEHAAELKNLGLDLPIKTSSQFESIKAGQNIESIANMFGEQKTFLDLRQSLDNFKETINQAEENLLLFTDGQIVTTPGDRGGSEVPLGDPNKVQEEYKKFQGLVRQGLGYAEYMKQFLTKLMDRVKEDPSKSSMLEYSGSVQAYQVFVDNLINTWRQLYFKYASVGLIAKQIQQKKFLMQQLKTLIPQLENYIGIGYNVADLINIPGGLGERLSNIIDQERQARDILFESISKLREYIAKNPNVQTTKTPTLPSAPATPQPATQPTQTSLQGQKSSNPLESLLKQKAGDWLTKQTGGSTGQFAPLIQNIFGKQAEITDPLLKVANSPEELSKRYTDGFKFASIIVEAANETGVNTPQFGYYLNQINNASNLEMNKNWILTKETKLQPQEKSQLIDMINRMIHYVGKLRDPGTNKTELKRLLNLDPKLTPEQKTTLNNMFEYNVGGLTNIAGQIIPTMPSMGFGSTTGVGATTGMGLTTTTPSTTTEKPKTTTTPGKAGVGSTLAPSTPEDEVSSELNSIFTNLNSVTGLNMNINPEAVKIQPEYYLKSLISTWRDKQEKYEELKGIQLKLLTDPSSLGSLKSIRANNISKFIKISDKELEADQKNIDYVGDYYNELYEDSDDKGYDYLSEDLPYGEAIKNPKKWRKVETKDIPNPD